MSGDVDDRFIVLVSGGRIAEGITDLLLSRAKTAWATRGDATTVKLDLNDLSVPPGLTAEVSMLPEPIDQSDYEPGRYVELAASFWGEVGKQALIWVLDEIRTVIAGGDYVFVPAEFDESRCKLAVIRGLVVDPKKSNLWTGTAIVGEPIKDEELGIMRVPIVAIILEDEESVFLRKPTPRGNAWQIFVSPDFLPNAKHMVGEGSKLDPSAGLAEWINKVTSPSENSRAPQVDMILRPSELDAGIYYLDEAEPLKATIVGTYEGKSYEQIICTPDITDQLAQAGDLVFRNVVINAITTLPQDDTPNDGSVF